ncbi:hypothetical protein GE061_007578 [Apolygus lucorum]|uniref:Uncharacterized protein n=1 Tax=Apolygus lucorum TaxID=248454 RepID=A0A8S9WS34_APOLU|nr:hypothetical protein GE061_007578 [Apolygus lucorum]
MEQKKTLRRESVQTEREVILSEQTDAGTPVLTAVFNHVELEWFYQPASAGSSGSAARSSAAPPAASSRHQHSCTGPVRSSRLASRVRAVPYPQVGTAGAPGGQFPVQSASASAGPEECRCRVELEPTCESAPRDPQRSTPMLFIPFSVPSQHHHLSQPAVSPSPASTPLIKVRQP